MKTGVAIIAVAWVWLVVVAHGQGTLQITFDGEPLQPPGSDYSVTNYHEFGILFSPKSPSRAFGRVFPGFPGDPHNGTAYVRTALTESLMFSFINGSLFGLVSVDLAEYSGAFSGDPATIQFIGYYADGSTVSTSFTTDGIIDGTGPLEDFETFYFGQEWSGLSRVEIPTSLWSLDNLAVAIPEPSALSLLGGGVLLLAWAARRPGRQ